MVVTLTYVGVALTLEFFLGLGLALLIFQKLKGMRFFRAFLILPTLTAPAAVGWMWLYIYDPNVGILNRFLALFGVQPLLWNTSINSSLLSVILMDVWQWTPFMFLILLAGFESVPEEVQEAVRVDGGSYWQALRHVTLPLMSTVIVVALMFRLMDLFRFYDAIAVLKAPAQSAEIITQHIFRQAFSYGDQGMASAESYILLLIMNVILFVFFLRRLR